MCDPVNGMHAEMFSGVLPSHCFAPVPSPAFGEPFDARHAGAIPALALSVQVLSFASLQALPLSVQALMLSVPVLALSVQRTHF